MTADLDALLAERDAAVESLRKAAYDLGCGMKPGLVATDLRAAARRAVSR